MKKLLVILGAGSSLGLGLPSVGIIDDLMKSWAAEWPGGTYGCENYYAAVEAAMRSYADASTRANQHRTINFETVLGDMAALANWVVPAPHGTTLRGLVGASELRLQFPEGRYGAAVAVNDQLTSLLALLAKHVRGLSRAIDKTSPAATSYGRLLSGLRQAFDVGIYNLNYDTAALTAWPDADTGFDANSWFAPKAVHERREWGFIYHLHGSVHHSLSHPFGPPILWRPELTGEFDDGQPHRSTENLSDGKVMPKTSLVAGGFKLDQLLVEPFHSFAAALVRHAHQADAILIGGYGFGDTHVNRALLNRLESGRGADRPPILILDFAPEWTDPMPFRCDAWARNLTHTLAVNGHFFSEAGYGPSAANPCELAERSAFELSGQHRTAIWYGGFEKAAERVDEIVSWLGGAADDVLKASLSPA